MQASVSELNAFFVESRPDKAPLSSLHITPSSYWMSGVYVYVLRINPDGENLTVRVHFSVSLYRRAPQRVVCGGDHLIYHLKDRLDTLLAR
jgi:hypothetical protein